MKSLVSAVLSALLFCGLASQAFGQDIDKIEEDWELIIGTPNPSRGSPQLTCVISPVSTLDSLYAAFQINQQTYPSGKIGGLQLQVMNGSTLVGYSTGETSVLDTVDEKIQWTTRMSVSGNTLTFAILSGTSTTWGKFPKQSEIAVSVPTTLKNLSAYNVNFSTENFGIDFGNARVAKVTLRKVRVYTGNKKSVEQALDRVVFP